MTGPNQYNQMFCNPPPKSAGPKCRAGFMAAPEIGPPIKISSATVNPIKSPPTFGALLSTAEP